MQVFNPISVASDANRFSQIVNVLIRHGFGYLFLQVETADTTLGKLIRKARKTEEEVDKLDTSLARRALLVLQDLGPTFIKLGQILSTRPDLIPVDFAEEFKTLQDNVPQFSFEEARSQIEKELGLPLEEIFAKFNKEPIGTASIGQVYTAELRTGEKVVVKVQRPNVRQIIESDIDLLYFFARWGEKQIPDLRLIEPVGIVSEFEKAIQNELNYYTELRNAIRFAEAFKYNDEVIIPKVYKEYSSKKIFTMEKINGVKITEAENIGCDRKYLAQVALKAVLYMVFEQGFFHADPHPGNIFALKGNKIAFLDFGMVGRLDQEMRDKIADLVIALGTRDADAVAKSIYLLGIREKKINFSKFKREVTEVLDKVIGLPLNEISFSEILQDLVEGAKRNQIKIPSDFTLMGKAILTIEGIGRYLDPEINLESEASPYVEKLIKERWNPQRFGSGVYNKAMQIYEWSNIVPTQLLTVLEDIENGNLKFKLEDVTKTESLKVWEDIIGKLTAGLVISSLIISSSIFIISTHGNFYIWGFPITLVLGIGGYIFAGILGLRIIRSIVKKSSK